MHRSIRKFTITTSLTALLLPVLAATYGCRPSGTVAGAISDAAVPDTAALRRALERVNALELDAIQRGDARAAAGFFAEDAVLLPPDGRVLRGRAAIEAYWAAGAGSVISDVHTRTV